MIRKSLLLVLIASISSCVSIKLKQNDMVGKYYKRHTKKNTISISYTLVLNSDESFTLTINTQDANPSCDGYWELVNDEILLECEEESASKMLSNSYLNERNYKLIVINKSKIRLRNSVLKKVN